VTPPVTRAGHAYLEGTLTTAPDSQPAYATIDRVRANVQAVPGADALVGGSTAINLDVQRAAAHDRNVISGEVPPAYEISAGDGTLFLLRSGGRQSTTAACSAPGQCNGWTLLDVNAATEQISASNGT
jgi:hypothetical protein